MLSLNYVCTCFFKYFFIKQFLISASRHVYYTIKNSNGYSNDKFIKLAMTF
jgi:hypothetical protein